MFKELVLENALSKQNTNKAKPTMPLVVENEDSEISYHSRNFGQDLKLIHESSPESDDGRNKRVANSKKVKNNI